MIFFDEDDASPDEPSSRQGWRYVATNGSVFAVMVALAVAGLLMLATLMVYSRVIVGWSLVLVRSVM
ncbi:hypothetical protein [Micromonospora coerulea]|uniref:hypothetical protein n=1 Tax=Micromonospora coerulea TaxID=47856 RepID=UPI001903D044|nr:hypothetical protein [Micromonospora veneta]